MATFLIGLVILFVGAAIYGKFCEKVFGPDDRETPADFVCGDGDRGQRFGLPYEHGLVVAGNIP